MLISYSLEDGAKEQLRHFYLMILLNLRLWGTKSKGCLYYFPSNDLRKPKPRSSRPKHHLYRLSLGEHNRCQTTLRTD